MKTRNKYYMIWFKDDQPEHAEDVIVLEHENNLEHEDDEIEEMGNLFIRKKEAEAARRLVVKALGLK